MSTGDIWLVVYLAIILVVLGILWVVQLLATSQPQHRSLRSQARELAEKEYEKNKQWARKQLGGRSTM